jgi:hypothetical protein
MRLTVNSHSTIPRSLSLDDLLAAPESQFGQLDIASQNLACAVGLPGAEGLDYAQCLRLMDQWAAQVRDATAARVPQFRQNPAWCDNSEAIFRMVVLVNHLQLECGVRYNPDRIYDPDFTDSRHLFIHGLFTDHGGTCASMPVFYVAIGRRLGYPLRLVEAKAHVFVRWDDAEGLSGFPPERVNIEGATRGMNSHPDDFYHDWPMRIEREELEAGQYLHSLTPREALASFLALRGNCLQDNARFDEAAHAYHHACLFAPHMHRYQMWNCVNAALCGVPVPDGLDGIKAIAVAERDRIAVLQRA